MIRWAFLILVCIPFSSSFAADDILLADFEGDNYAGWTATGDAFGKGPAQGTLPNQQPVDGYLGRGLADSFLNGDRSRGTLTSKPFTINRDYITFLIGGGAHDGRTCINLLIDNKIVRTATGEEAEHLSPFTWDVRDVKNKTATLQIVDNETAGWGHINIDQITLTDNPKTPPLIPQLLYHETYRPQFHFTPAKNWMNDPNGLVFFEGNYHLFFQHNPTSTKWGNMTWGHAISTDLMHWRQLGNALEPDSMGTMFSGSAVVDPNNTSGLQKGNSPVLIAIYTAAGNTSDASKGKKFTQCLAYSNDAGKTWTKYQKNPVLPHIRGENRDPKVCWDPESRQWVMVLYLDANDFAFFVSPDLKTWRQIQTLTMPGCAECPDFFRSVADGLKWVFTAANARYLIGDFDGKLFKPESATPLQVEYGKGYYAVQTYNDTPDARRIQIGWMNNGRYPRMPFNHQMSFPRSLIVRQTSDGLRLFNLPIEEIGSLRASGRASSALRGAHAIKPGQNPLAEWRGECFDLRAELEPGNAEQFGLRLRGEPILYNVKTKQLTTATIGSAPLELENGMLKLHILVDRTSMEIFANNGLVSISGCFLPPPDNRFIEMVAIGGDAGYRTCEMRELRSIWPVTPPIMPK